MAKTLVALYDDPLAAHQVVRALLALGLRREDLGVLAHEEAGGPAHEQARARARLRDALDAGNAVVGGMTGAIVGLGLAAVPLVGPVLAAVPFALGAIGAGVGERFQSWIDELGAFGIPADDASLYAEGVRRGGLVVTARVHDDWVARAESILARGGAVPIDERAEAWRREGFAAFDPDASPFTAEEIGRERARRTSIPPSRASTPPDRTSRPSLPM